MSLPGLHQVWALPSVSMSPTNGEYEPLFYAMFAKAVYVEAKLTYWHKMGEESTTTKSVHFSYKKKQAKKKIYNVCQSSNPSFSRLYNI